jgi:hypothetical protein
MSLESNITMHDVMNPPFGNRRSNIQLRLINTQGKITFTDTATNNRVNLLSNLIQS